MVLAAVRWLGVASVVGWWFGGLAVWVCFETRPGARVNKAQARVVKRPECIQAIDPVLGLPRHLWYQQA